MIRSVWETVWVIVMSRGVTPDGAGQFMYSDDENRITQEPTRGGQIDVNTQLPFCSCSVIQLIVNAS